MSLILALLLKHWRWFALAAFLLAVTSAVGYRCYQMGQANGEQKVRAYELAQAKRDAKVAQDNQRLAEEQRDRERRKAEGLAAIADQYLEELNHANDRADKLAGDVRSGAVRIRKLWAQCEAVSRPGPAPADPGEPEDRAGLQAASLGRIDRAVGSCQAHVEALLKVAECDRGLRADCKG